MSTRNIYVQLGIDTYLGQVFVKFPRRHASVKCPVQLILVDYSDLPDVFFYPFFIISAFCFPHLVIRILHPHFSIRKESRMFDAIKSISVSHASSVFNQRHLDSNACNRYPHYILTQKCHNYNLSHSQLENIFRLN